MKRYLKLNQILKKQSYKYDREIYRNIDKKERHNKELPSRRKIDKSLRFRPAPKKIASNKVNLFLRGVNSKNNYLARKTKLKNKRQTQDEETEKVLAEFKLLHGVEDQSLVNQKHLLDRILKKNISTIAGKSKDPKLTEREKARLRKDQRKKDDKTSSRREGLEALKRELDARRQAIQTGGPAGGPPLKPETTNLYVCNLPKTITEKDMMEVFSGYGPVQSVKIMWPRTLEEHKRGII